MAEKLAKIFYVGSNSKLLDRTRKLFIPYGHNMVLTAHNLAETLRLIPQILSLQVNLAIIESTNEAPTIIKSQEVVNSPLIF